MQFYMTDVSFAVPQRKKLTLELTAGEDGGGERERNGGGYLRARNQVSKDVEFGVPVDKIRMFFFFLAASRLLTMLSQNISSVFPCRKKISDSSIYALFRNTRME